MVDIEFSIIPDSDVDLQTFTTLTNQFGNKFGVKVNLNVMHWGTAWTDIITIATHGKGPDVSHIGSTWVSTLATMNALRTFSREDINAIGGNQVFLAPNWESCIIPDSKEIWAIPWTAYMYVICYRKDILAQAGIDETSAFENLEQQRETIKRLQSAKVEIPWLTPAIAPPYQDYLHIAASWIWGAGGDFIDSTGRQIVFDSPQAQRGLCAWLDTNRAVPEIYHDSGSDITIELFARGRVGAILTDIRSAATLENGDIEPVVRENLGIATVTNVPWCGGGNFIVWQHTVGYPERHQAAKSLVRYLASKEIGQQWCQAVGAMPARLDVIDSIYAAGHPMRNALLVAAHHGRAYRTVPLWRRLEYQIAQELQNIRQDAFEHPQDNTEDIVRRHIEPLAARLNLTFGA